jgi:hypothetical protein
MWIKGRSIKTQTIEPRFEQPRKPRKYKLKFDGQTKVPRSLRRKCKKELPFDHETKKMIRV